MRYSFLAVIAFFSVITAALPSRAAEKPLPPQINSSKHVWTNEDLEGLRAEGLISTFNQPSSAAQQSAATSQAAPPESAFPVYSPRLEDPEWYAKQSADLQAILDERLAALSQAQADLAQAADGITQPGINLNKGNPGITPEAGIDVLEARVSDVQSQLDGLSDLARRNNIPPGVLRG